MPLNGIAEFTLEGGTKVCVLNAGERFYACQAACPHDGVALREGTFDGKVLVCLEHLWQWNLAEDGEPQGLAESALKMYPVEVKAGAVYVRAPKTPKKK